MANGNPGYGQNSGSANVNLPPFTAFGTEGGKKKATKKVAKKAAKKKK